MAPDRPDRLGVSGQNGILHLESDLSTEKFVNRVTDPKIANRPATRQNVHLQEIGELAGRPVPPFGWAVVRRKGTHFNTQSKSRKRKVTSR
jgi:hypothetical protein